MTDLGATGFQPVAKKKMRCRAEAVGKALPFPIAIGNGKGWERSGEKPVPMNIGRVRGIEPAAGRV